MLVPGDARDKEGMHGHEYTDIISRIAMNIMQPSSIN